MRTYAKEIAMLGEVRRQMEEYLQRDQPELKPSERRSIARQCVMKAYAELKNGKTNIQGT